MNYRSQLSDIEGRMHQPKNDRAPEIIAASGRYSISGHNPGCAFNDCTPNRLMHGQPVIFDLCLRQSTRYDDSQPERLATNVRLDLDKLPWEKELVGWVNYMSPNKEWGVLELRARDNWHGGEHLLGIGTLRMDVVFSASSLLDYATVPVPDGLLGERFSGCLGLNDAETRCFMIDMRHDVRAYRGRIMEQVRGGFLVRALDGQYQGKEFFLLGDDMFRPPQDVRVEATLRDDCAGQLEFGVREIDGVLRAVNACLLADKTPKRERLLV